MGKIIKRLLNSQAVTILAYLLVGFLFIIVKFYVFGQDQTRIYPDTQSYSLAASHSILDKSFWVSLRPVTMPLVYKAFGLEGEVYQLDGAGFDRLVRVQAFIAGTSWLVLAVTFSSGLRNRLLRFGSFSALLALGVSIDVSQWDRILLSESISISLLVLLISASVLGLRHWEAISRSSKFTKIFYVFGFGMLVFLYSFTRDINSYFLLFAALFGGAALALQMLLRNTNNFGLLIPVGLMLAIFTIQYLSADVGYRWYGPYKNVFFDRIRFNQEAMELYIGQGLPVDKPTLEQIQGYTRDEFKDYLASSEGREINAFLRSHGKLIYLHFLLQEPMKLLGRPILELDHILNPDSTEYRSSSKSDPGWLIRLSEIVNIRSLALILVLTLFPMVGLSKLWRQRVFVIEWVIPILLVFSALPMIYVVYYTDTIELERHSMQIALQMRIAAWMMAFYVADGVARRMRETPVTRVRQ